MQEEGASARVGPCRCLHTTLRAEQRRGHGMGPVGRALEVGSPGPSWLLALLSPCVTGARSPRNPPGRHLLFQGEKGGAAAM